MYDSHTVLRLLCSARPGPVWGWWGHNLPFEMSSVKAWGGAAASPPCNASKAYSKVIPAADMVQHGLNERLLDRLSRVYTYRSWRVAVQPACGHAEEVDRLEAEGCS